MGDRSVLGLAVILVSLTLLAEPEPMVPAASDDALDWSEQEYIEAQIQPIFPSEVDIADKEEKVMQEYFYASFSSADPFVPPPISELLAKEEIPITSILQLYPAAILKVVGIWELATQDRKALIMTPKNQGVTVREGDQIGRKGGVVKEIERDHIVVRTFELSPDGTRRYEDKTLWLGTKPEANPRTITIRSDRISRQVIRNKEPEVSDEQNESKG